MRLKHCVIKSFLYATLLLMVKNTFSQVPHIEWQKTLGGTGDERGYAIQQTMGGGYIVAGTMSSNDGDVSGYHGGVTDIWIVKLNVDGNIEWQKALGGTSGDYILNKNSIQQTTDGGYIVAGFTWSNDGDVSGNHDGFDIWIVKLSAVGNIEWQKALGGSGNEISNAIQQTMDGGYIVAGYTNSNDGDVSGIHGSGSGTYSDDYWIIKLSAEGNIEWQKALGGSGYEISNAIQQTMDGGYIVAGYTSSNDGDVSGNHGISDIWIVKLSAVGNIEWQKALGGTDNDQGYAIQQTTDGGYIVAGYTSSIDGDVSGNHGTGYTYEYWIVKLSAEGNIEWQKALGGSGNEISNAIQQTMDGGYIVAGYTSSNDGDVSGNHGISDIWIVKLSAVGNIEWQKALGGTDNDQGYAIQQTTDGGYIVAGATNSNDGDVSGNHGLSDFWIVKLEIECNATLTEVSRKETLAGILCPDANEVELKYTSNLDYSTWALHQPDLQLLNIGENGGSFEASKNETIKVKLPAPIKSTQKYIFIAYINDDHNMKCLAKYSATGFPTNGCDGTITYSLLKPASSSQSEDGKMGFLITTSACETGNNPWVVVLVNTATQFPYAGTSYNKFVTVSGLPAGTYKVSFGDLGGFCKYKDVATIQVPIGLSGRSGGEAPAGGTGLSATISPNPAQTTAEISLSGNSPSNIHLTDLSGRVLWKRDNITEKKVSIPLQNIHKGTYIIIVNSNKEMRTLKLVKTE